MVDRNPKRGEMTKHRPVVVWCLKKPGKEIFPKPFKPEEKGNYCELHVAVIPEKFSEIQVLIFMDFIMIPGSDGKRQTIPAVM